MKTIQINKHSQVLNYNGELKLSIKIIFNKTLNWLYNYTSVNSENNFCTYMKKKEIKQTACNGNAVTVILFAH